MPSKILHKTSKPQIVWKTIVLWMQISNPWWVNIHNSIPESDPQVWVAMFTVLSPRIGAATHAPPAFMFSLLSVVTPHYCNLGGPYCWVKYIFLVQNVLFIQSVCDALPVELSLKQSTYEQYGTVYHSLKWNIEIKLYGISLNKLYIILECKE